MDECDQGNRTPSPKSTYLLHIMAGCNTTVALDTAKYLLDTGQCLINEPEPQDLLTPLHIAASWDNLMMCQLFVHYGANLLAMNRDNFTPSDIAKGSSREFLRGLMKRGEKKKKRRIFKFLGYLFQPRKAKTTQQVTRSASTQCIPPPKKPTLNQEIDDYLLNANTYNSRLSSNRFSGFLARSAIGHSVVKKDAELISTQMQDLNLEPNADRTSSISSYKTAFDDKMGNHLSEQENAPSLRTSISNENQMPSTSTRDLPLTSTFPSLYPAEKIKEKPLIDLSNREQVKCPTPSAPPLTPQITQRRRKIVLFKLDDTKKPSNAPSTLPRSTSLCAALVPHDIPPTPRVSDCSEVSNDDSNGNALTDDPIISELATKAASLSLEQLKGRLNRHNFSPGPLNRSNRRLYERKLAQLEVNAMRGVEYEMTRKKMGFRFSIALERIIKADELNEQLLIGLLEEQLIQDEFKDSPNNDDISFFCYLLIDITDLLPNPSFREFLCAIFYIGKGKRSRPLCHFSDTVKHRLNPKGEPSKKISHILKIWNQGMGVVSLHLFNNIHSAEALVREGAMIEAMTLENLDNLQRGNFNGLSRAWSRQRQAEYGAFLLKKAYNIYQNERCRPIFEKDVIDMKFW